jgi:dihydroorotase
MYHAHEHYVIKNVELWTSQHIPSHCDVEVQHGRLLRIHEKGSAPAHIRVIDGQGYTLLPAGVDPQVHLRVPGQEEKETAGTGLLAALRGGIGAVLTMPNTRPAIDSVDVLEAGQMEVEETEKLLGVKVCFTGAISLGLKGKVPAPYKELARQGVRAFTDDGVGVVDDSIMRAVFRASAETGLPVLQHAEFPGHGGVLAEGPVQGALGIEAYPAKAESDMVARDIRLLKEFPGARYHVLHVSSRETLELVAAAKSQNMKVSCEVTPHHLWFASNDILGNNTSFQMNPPLRSAADREALRRALRDGVIDFVATDHAPHEAAVKGSNFKTAAFGTTGLETSLRVLLSLVDKGELSPERLVEVFADKPAHFLGLDDQFGSLEVGKPFHATLVNRHSRSRVSEEDLYSLSKNSCFLGSELSGRIEAVFAGDRHYNFS